MPSIYQLKPAFQGLLRPLTRSLAQAGVTANQVTLSALLLSFFTGLAVITWINAPAIFLMVPLALFIRMALNAIDGMLAREHDMKTPLGAFLNEMGDVLSDTFLYLPFALIQNVHAWLVVGAVLGAVLSEMAGVVAVQMGASRRYDGPMGKSDRAFVFGAVALALGLGLTPGWWLNLLLGIVLVLLTITILNRLRFALKELAA